MLAQPESEAERLSLPESRASDRQFRVRSETLPVRQPAVRLGEALPAPGAPPAASLAAVVSCHRMAET
eukprot:3939448-Rhodomonas_salina.2